MHLTLPPYTQNSFSPSQLTAGLHRYYRFGEDTFFVQTLSRSVMLRLARYFLFRPSGRYRETALYIRMTQQHQRGAGTKMRSLIALARLQRFFEKGESVSVCPFTISSVFFFSRTSRTCVHVTQIGLSRGRDRIGDCLSARSIFALALPWSETH